MPPYIKWSYLIGVSLMIVSIVFIAGCLNVANTSVSNNHSIQPTPMITAQKPVVTPEQPRASPDLTNPNTQTTPKQTVYNSPENGPRMTDLPAYKGNLPSVTPTPTPTPTPVTIRIIR